MRLANSLRAAVAGLALVCAPAWAAVLAGDPITFANSGVLTLTFTGSNAGYDHVIELANTPGSVGTPIFVATSGSPASASVLGYTPAAPGATFALGAYAANTELVFRLTNVESGRLGTPGLIATQVFSGTASSLNPPDPLPPEASGLPYVLVTPDGDPNVLYVGFEDLFPTYSSYDKLTFTLTLAPVPEPSEWAMMIAGLGLVGVIAKRRRGRAA